MTIENLLRIDKSVINGEKTRTDETYIVVHKDKNCTIEYFYNGKHKFWSADIITWDYDTGFMKIGLHVFDTVEDVIKQIYYITGYYHGLKDK